MRNRLLALLALSLLCGCSDKAAEAAALESAKKEAVAKAETALVERLKLKVSERLRDPSSAQFRNLRLNSAKDFLCGEVNGTNGFGGYSGFVEFAAGDTFFLIRDKPIALMPSNSPYVETLKHTECFEFQTLPPTY